MTNWVAISTDVLKTSRKARGLSYEAMGRLAKVSSKTYERYERDGRVPEHMVDTFAEILGLEIDRPESVTTRVTLEAEPRGAVTEWLTAMRLLVQLDHLSPELRTVAEAAAAELEASGHAAFEVAAALRARLAQETSVSQPTAVK